MFRKTMFRQTMSIGIAMMAALVMVASVHAVEIAPIVALTGSNGGDRYANGMDSLINGSGIDKTADPSDPAAWVFSGGAYQDEWMAWYFKDGDGLPTTGLNGKLAWASFDLGSPTSLQTLYLFNNNYQGGISGLQDYNLYYADAPSVALPAQPPKNQYSTTGLTPQGDYDFGSGGWTLFNTSGLLTAPKAAVGTVDLTGVTARYLAVEIITNYGDTYKGGRVGFDEIAITKNLAPAQAGDFNLDTQVEQTDLNLLLANWGASTVPAEWTAPFDGLVDQSELNDLLANWGAGVSGADALGAAETVVPEPATLGLLLIGGLAAIRRRK